MNYRRRQCEHPSHDENINVATFPLKMLGILVLPLSRDSLADITDILSPLEKLEMQLRVPCMPPRCVAAPNTAGSSPNESRQRHLSIIGESCESVLASCSPPSERLWR
jgi:hypothetical protein